MWKCQLGIRTVSPSSAAVSADLARQAAGPRRMRREIEHVLLLLARGRQAREVRGVDDHMAGRAGHLALARALQRLAIGLPRRRAGVSPSSASTVAPVAVARRRSVTRIMRAAASAARRSACRARPRSSSSRRVAPEAEADRLTAPQHRSARSRAARGSAAPIRSRRPSPRRRRCRAIGHQPRDIEAVAAEVEIAAIASLDRAVERPAAARRARAHARTAGRHERHRASAPLGISAAAAPNPAHSAGDSVPERPPPPARRRGAAARASTPSRIHSAPMPLGPWILCAEIATRSQPSGIGTRP